LFSVFCSVGRSGAYVEIPRHPAKGVLPANPTTITLPNGTLLISTTNSLGADGKLLTLVCEAENGIGSGISKLIQLRINGKSEQESQKSSLVFPILCFSSFNF